MTRKRKKYKKELNILNQKIDGFPIKDKVVREIKRGTKFNEKSNLINDFDCFLKIADFK